MALPIFNINRNEAPLLNAYKEAVQEGAKHDTTVAPAGPYGHGPGGLFAVAGQDPSVFSAIISPVPGLMSELPAINNAMDGENGQFGGVNQEYLSTLTGVTQGALESFANQPAEACADGARAGLKKLCTLVVPFGRYRFAPQAPIDIVRAGMRRDLADPLTLRLMNTPRVQQVFGVPTLMRSAQNALQNEFANRVYEMGESIARFMARQAYTANPTNNNGEAKQFTGADLWINENNKRDKDTQSICTALNSDLKNFGYDLISGSGRDIQEYAEMMFDFLDFNSTRMLLGAWEGFITVMPTMWREITRSVQIRQFQSALTQLGVLNNASAQLVISGAEVLAFRNEMYNAKMWPLSGRMVRVVMDDGIAESTPNEVGLLLPGQYAGDIYFHNTRAAGVPTTYWKFFDHANTNSDIPMLPAPGGDVTFTTDGGMFRWYISRTKNCLDWTIDFLPRLIYRTSQLCGRIQNVAFQPLQHFRSPFPDSSYFADGGRTNSPTTQLYTMWGGTTLQTL